MLCSRSNCWGIRIYLLFAIVVWFLVTFVIGIGISFLSHVIPTYLFW